MSGVINGSVQDEEVIKGRVDVPDVVVGLSAYELAVKHGYQGTEEEWIEFIKGIKSIPPKKDGTYEIYLYDMEEGIYYIPDGTRVIYRASGTSTTINTPCHMSIIKDKDTDRTYGQYVAGETIYHVYATSENSGKSGAISFTNTLNRAKNETISGEYTFEKSPQMTEEIALDDNSTNVVSTAWINLLLSSGRGITHLPVNEEGYNLWKMGAGIYKLDAGVTIHSTSTKKTQFKNDIIMVTSISVEKGYVGAVAFSQEASIVRLRYAFSKDETDGTVFSNFDFYKIPDKTWVQTEIENNKDIYYAAYGDTSDYENFIDALEKGKKIYCLDDTKELATSILELECVNKTIATDGAYWLEFYMANSATYYVAGCVVIPNEKVVKWNYHQKNSYVLKDQYDKRNLSVDVNIKYLKTLTQGIMGGEIGAPDIEANGSWNLVPNTLVRAMASKDDALRLCKADGSNVFDRDFTIMDFYATNVANDGSFNILGYAMSASTVFNAAFQRIRFNVTSGWYLKNTSSDSDIALYRDVRN